MERMLDGKVNGCLVKKPLLLGYTVKDCQNLGYIIKGSTGHRYLAKKEHQNKCGQLLIPGR